MRIKKGKFVVFDGSDGSGKQTQVAMLKTYLQGKKMLTETIDFPQYENNFHGKVLRASLRGDFGNFISLDPYVASFLYIADRFESVAKIKKLIADGYIVIADRFTTSNMIHQGGKFPDKIDRDKYLKWLTGLEFGYLNFPKPDAVIFLRVPVAVSLKLLKGKKGRDQAEKCIPYLTNSLTCSEAVAKKYKWAVVDCAPHGNMRSRESIHKEVVSKLKAIIL